MPRISCYAYACPSCTSANLAEAFRDDGLVMVMVNRDDPIPRISRASMMRLAEKVIAFAPTADEWFEQDKAGTPFHTVSCVYTKSKNQFYSSIIFLCTYIIYFSIRTSSIL